MNTSMTSGSDSALREAAQNVLEFCDSLDVTNPVVDVLRSALTSPQGQPQLVKGEAMFGFNMTKGDPMYFSDACKDMWADTGLSVDIVDVQIILEWFAKRRHLVCPTPPVPAPSGQERELREALSLAAKYMHYEPARGSDTAAAHDEYHRVIALVEAALAPSPKGAPHTEGGK